LGVAEREGGDHGGGGGDRRGSCGGRGETLGEGELCCMEQSVGELRVEVRGGVHGATEVLFDAGAAGGLIMAGSLPVSVER
jgi:hypothetical protein